jgi:hypothetical protein
VCVCVHVRVRGMCVRVCVCVCVHLHVCVFMCLCIRRQAYMPVSVCARGCRGAYAFPCLPMFAQLSHCERAQGTKGLTCVSNNAGVDDFGLGLLLKKHQVWARAFAPSARCDGRCVCYVPDQAHDLVVRRRKPHV